MLALALTALLPLAALPQDPPAPPPPAKEVVANTVAALKTAFAGKELPPKLQAIEQARSVPDKAVATALVKGMKEERDVQQAALNALRWMEHPQALKELHSLYKRDKKLAEDEELFPILLKAIGQHSSTDSIEVLTDNPFKGKSPQALEARILGLGRIRDERSVAELMAMMQLAGKGKTLNKMDDFRIAMMALTGVDKGKSREAWIGWWNDNKKTLELPKEMPRLPEKLQRRWDYFWGEPHEKSRAEKREDRGGDE